MMIDFCSMWNIPEHIRTDGGPQMMSGVFQKWFKQWDIKHHPISAYLPHSNSRAETSVKSSKRMLQDCITKSGDTDNDKFMKVVLQYRNTPHQDCKKSPAQRVFGRTLHDHLQYTTYFHQQTKSTKVIDNLQSTINKMQIYNLFLINKAYQ